MNIQRKKILELIFSIVVIYMCGLGWLYYRQRGMIFFPDQSLPDAARFGMELATTKTDDGLVLNGWYRPPVNPSGLTILLFHGNGGNIAMRDFKARVFTDAGYGVLLAEYRGYGGNPGEASEEGFFRDGQAWLSWLATMQYGFEKIVVYGESIGSGTAVFTAAQSPRPVRALILETPFTSLVDVAQRSMPFVPVGLLLKDRFDNTGRIKNISVPLLVLHGTADSTVPYDLGLRLYEAANDPKRMETFPGGEHNDLYDHGAGEKIVSFLRELEKH